MLKRTVPTNGLLTLPLMDDAVILATRRKMHEEKLAVNSVKIMVC